MANKTLFKSLAGKLMPALLCAVLSVKDRALLAQVFPRVIDNAKML